MATKVNASSKLVLESLLLLIGRIRAKEIQLVQRGSPDTRPSVGLRIPFHASLENDDS